MSGERIDPDKIPGTNVVPEDIAAAAAAFLTAATAIGEKGSDVETSWSGLAGVYSAPEAPQLLAAMLPVKVDTHAIAIRLTSVAGFLDTLAESVAAPIARLKELQFEAQAFVDSVREGVVVGPYDPDNTIQQATAMSGSPMIVLDGSGDQTLSWSEHTPSVARNNELLHEVNVQLEKVLAARAECVNGINSLRDDICLVLEEAPTVEQLDATVDLAWGAQGNGDRSCNESVGDGIFTAWDGLARGVSSLVGITWGSEASWSWDTVSISWDTAGAAWGGALQGLGAIAISGPPAIAFALTPNESVPVPLRGAHDWYTGQIEGIVGGIVGTPEQWEEDPVAAGTYAVLSIGTMFIPVAGVTAGATKVTSGLAKTALAAERLAGKTPNLRLSNGLSTAGQIFSELSDAVRIRNGGSVDSGSLQKAIDEVAALDDLTPNNINSAIDGAARSADDVAGTGRAADPPAAAHANGDSSSSAPGTTTLERELGNDGDGTDGGSIDDADAPSPSDDMPTTHDRTDTDSDSLDSGSDSPIPLDTQRSIAIYERLAERYPKLANMFEGSIFNLENAHRYDYNEITLDVKIEHPDGTVETRRTRIDSYTPDSAVVSRKNTQFAEVNFQTAKHYIDQFVKNYSADDAAFTIADTDKNKLVMPERIGDPLQGDMYLEVPEQVRSIPANIVAYAAKNGIRFITAPPQ